MTAYAFGYSQKNNGRVSGTHVERNEMTMKILVVLTLFLLIFMGKARV
ncbi:MAG: hypothetical protein H6Q76_1683 [Firmicutes bacterium]|nr:hypothetical protein [Bacillota bacterium]